MYRRSGTGAAQMAVLLPGAALLLMASCLRTAELEHAALWRDTLWQPLATLPELLALAILLCRPGLVASIGTAGAWPPPQPPAKVHPRRWARRHAASAPEFDNSVFRCLSCVTPPRCVIGVKADNKQGLYAIMPSKLDASFSVSWDCMAQLLMHSRHLCSTPTHNDTPQRSL